MCIMHHQQSAPSIIILHVNVAGIVVDSQLLNLQLVAPSIPTKGVLLGCRFSVRFILLAYSNLSKMMYLTLWRARRNNCAPITWHYRVLLNPLNCYRCRQISQYQLNQPAYSTSVFDTFAASDIVMRQFPTWPLLLFPSVQSRDSRQSIHSS